MKLIIQIPCLNERETLPITIADLPKAIDGLDEIEILIIDDGSTDDTVKVAKECGANHVVSLGHNQGLATAFTTGIQTALDLGADIIVNTDADNQYCGADIEKLVKPILAGESDFVIGERPIMQTEHFSLIKKLLQKLGSWVVRLASGTDIPDAPSGFRALSRKAAEQVNVFSEYTYTLETVIQAGQRNMRISSVPIRTNEELRPSRLFGSIPQYIQRSVFTIVRIFVVYKPFLFFFTIGAFLFLIGAMLGLRFMYFYFGGDSTGHIQSLILASILLGIGTQTILVAFIADMLAVNRKLLEQIKMSTRIRHNK
jgi:glycosyltransferase involved in cell wall biosynthesis